MVPHPHTEDQQIIFYQLRFIKQIHTATSEGLFYINNLMFFTKIFQVCFIMIRLKQSCPWKIETRNILIYQLFLRVPQPMKYSHRPPKFQFYKLVSSLFIYSNCVSLCNYMFHYAIMTM